MNDRTSLRRATALAALVAVALLTSACGGEDADDASSGEDPATSSDAGWSFTDDRGITHEFDSRPDTIAAQSVAAGGLWEYGIDVAGVFGPLRRADGSTDPAIGLADPDDFTSLGEIDSEINLEALAALHPDLIVTAMWGEDMYWGIDDAEVDQIEQIAPIVGIRVDNRPIDEPLARFAELAESLGADDEVTEAKQRFDDATKRLTEAIEAKPGLVVLAGSGTLEEMYVAYPPGFPDLNYYQGLGMDLVVPEDHPTSGGFWETLSWEQADKYPADLVLADTRTGTIEQMLEQMPATAKSLPAIAAGQIIPWLAAGAFGYGFEATILDQLTEAISSASSDIAG